MCYVSIFTLQQLLLCVHLLVIAELSSVCHSSVLLTRCMWAFPLHIVDPPSHWSLGTSALRECCPTPWPCWPCFTPRLVLL